VLLVGSRIKSGSSMSSGQQLRTPDGRISVEPETRYGKQMRYESSFLTDRRRCVNRPPAHGVVARRARCQMAGWWVRCTGTTSGMCRLTAVVSGHPRDIGYLVAFIPLHPPLSPPGIYNICPPPDTYPIKLSSLASSFIHLRT